MIDYQTFSAFLIASIIVMQVLALIFRGKRIWDYTDYLWYFLAAGSLLLFVFDANEAAYLSKQALLKFELGEFFDTGVASFASELNKKGSLYSWVYELQNLKEHRHSLDFPTGGYVTLTGKTYPNAIEYLATWENPNITTDMPSVFPEAMFFDRVEIASAQQKVKELVAASRPTNFVTPKMLHWAAYALAMGAALRLAKTTALLKKY